MELAALTVELLLQCACSDVTRRASPELTTVGDRLNGGPDRFVVLLTDVLIKQPLCKQHICRYVP